MVHTRAALRLVVVGHELGLAGGHINPDGTVDLAALARQAELERVVNVLVVPAGQFTAWLEHLE